MASRPRCTMAAHPRARLSRSTPNASTSSVLPAARAPARLCARCRHIRREPEAPLRGEPRMSLLNCIGGYDDEDSWFLSRKRTQGSWLPSSRCSAIISRAPHSCRLSGPTWCRCELPQTPRTRGIARIDWSNPLDSFSSAVRDCHSTRHQLVHAFTFADPACVLFRSACST